MTDKSLLRLGVFGTVLVALCCFTPVLVVLFALLGLSALTGYLDWVLFPSLAFFITLSLYAVWRQKRQKSLPDQEGKV